MDRVIWTWRSLRHAWQRRLGAWWQQRAAWRRFWGSYRSYRGLAPADRQPQARFLYPCVGDDVGQTVIEPTYFYQDAWAFEKIVSAKPARHVDVGSHHKFVALLSKVVPVTMVDIRPLSVPLDSLKFLEGTLLDLPFESGSVPSVSSLCVVEHVGLGRYGDPLDPAGSEKALAELKRVVQPGGDLYISVPLHNENRTYFNAHRTFTEPYLLEMFAPFDLLERRYIYGQEYTQQLRSGFGTGCYHLRRPDR
ncbi:MAG: DUF268 domain-containing protein [Phycisphaerae bacterium]